MYYTKKEITDWYYNVAEQKRIRSALSKAFRQQDYLIDDSLQEFWLFGTKSDSVIPSKYSITNRAIYFCRAYYHTIRLTKSISKKAGTIEELHDMGVDWWQGETPETELLKKETRIGIWNKVQSIHPMQSSILSSFIKDGDSGHLTKLASKKGKTYNTFKANYRLGIITLRKILNKDEFCLDLNPDSSIYSNKHAFDERE